MKYVVHTVESICISKLNSMAYKKNETNISTRIKDLMKEKGLKSVELAEKVGITPVSVSYIINNKTTPSIEMLQKIADVIDVPLWQLFVSPEALNVSREKENEMRCPHCGKPIKVELSKVQ